MFAVVKIGGSQYIVEPKKKLKVALQGVPSGERVIFDKVLFVVDGAKVSFGKPFVKGARVEAKVLAHGRRKKVIVFKYRSKTRYRVKRGFRHQFTEIEVEKIIA
ncbi:MAG: 50S ribosomal protein L21 [Parcubacteria group bacterium]|nr:50S ribosomal protein L21 [Parcubacteria group bacterium]